MASRKVPLAGSLLTLPAGLWRLERRPYFSRLSLERNLPWCFKETLEDSRYHHDVIQEAGFDLISILAKGSFSVVWRGCWRQYGLPVALKIYEKKSASGFPNQLHNISAEVEILRSVTHPYIVKCFGVYETEFRIYICLELLGGDLLHYIKKHGPVNEKLGKKWFAQLVAATMHLHELRIAHCDIKCENVLVDANRNLKLTDFGFSLPHSEWDESIPNSDWRKVNDFCGSEAYFSPEILLRHPYSPLLADVWALGVVIYAALTASFPFDTSVEDFDPKNMPTTWKIPSLDPPLSDDGITAFKKVFLLEKRRLRSTELLGIEWLNMIGDELYEVEVGLKATKTPKEVEIEEARYFKAKIDFWGPPHPLVVRSRLNCLTVD